MHYEHNLRWSITTNYNWGLCSLVQGGEVETMKKEQLRRSDMRNMSRFCAHAVRCSNCGCLGFIWKLFPVTGRRIVIYSRRYLGLADMLELARRSILWHIPPPSFCHRLAERMHMVTCAPVFVRFPVPPPTSPCLKHHLLRVLCTLNDTMISPYNY